MEKGSKSVWKKAQKGREKVQKGREKVQKEYGKGFKKGEVG